MNASPGWLRPAAAAEYASVSERTVRTWLRDGLRSVRVRGVVLVKVSWLDDFLEAHEQIGGEMDLDRIVNEIVADL